jgi:GMP reductase
MREYKFRNSGATYTGVPVMAANMDTTGTFEIAKTFAEHSLFVCIHKHYRLVRNLGKKS